MKGDLKFGLFLAVVTAATGAVRYGMENGWKWPFAAEQNAPPANLGQPEVPAAPNLPDINPNPNLNPNPVDPAEPDASKDDKSAFSKPGSGNFGWPGFSEPAPTQSADSGDGITMPTGLTDITPDGYQTGGMSGPVESSIATPVAPMESTSAAPMETESMPSSLGIPSVTQESVETSGSESAMPLALPPPGSVLPPIETPTASPQPKVEPKPGNDNFDPNYPPSRTYRVENESEVKTTAPTAEQKMPESIEFIPYTQPKDESPLVPSSAVENADEPQASMPSSAPSSAAPVVVMEHDEPSPAAEAGMNELNQLAMGLFGAALDDGKKSSASSPSVSRSEEAPAVPVVKSFDIPVTKADPQSDRAAKSSLPPGKGPIHPYFLRYLESKEYYVRPGDSLDNIAERLYQDRTMVDLLLESNRDQLTGPSDLRPGMTLRLP